MSSKLKVTNREGDSHGEIVEINDGDILGY